MKVFSFSSGMSVVAISVLALSSGEIEPVEGLKMNQLLGKFRGSQYSKSKAEIAWHKFVEEYDYNMWRVASKKSFLTNGGNFYITKNYEIKKTNLNDFDLPQRFTIVKKDGKDMIKTSFVMNKDEPFYYNVPELFPDVPIVANALVHEWNRQNGKKEIDIEDSQSPLPPSLGVTADFFVKDERRKHFFVTDTLSTYVSIWGLSMFQDANDDGRLNVSVDKEGKPTGVRKLQTLKNEGFLLRSVTGAVKRGDGETGTPVLKNLANLKDFMEKSLNFGAAGAKNGQHQWIEIHGFSGKSNVSLNKMHYRYRDHDGSREYKTIQDVENAIQKFEEYRQIRKLVEEDNTKSTSSADAYQRILTENRKPVVEVRILGGRSKSTKLSSLKLPLLYNVEEVGVEGVSDSVVAESTGAAVTKPQFVQSIEVFSRDGRNDVSGVSGLPINVRLLLGQKGKGIGQKGRHSGAAPKQGRTSVEANKDDPDVEVAADVKAYYARPVPVGTSSFTGNVLDAKTTRPAPKAAAIKSLKNSYLMKKGFSLSSLLPSKRITPSRHLLPRVGIMNVNRRKPKQENKILVNANYIVSGATKPISTSSSAHGHGLEVDATETTLLGPGISDGTDVEIVAKLENAADLNPDATRASGTISPYLQTVESPYEKTTSGGNAPLRSPDVQALIKNFNMQSRLERAREFKANNVADSPSVGRVGGADEDTESLSESSEYSSGKLDGGDDESDTALVDRESQPALKGSSLSAALFKPIGGLIRKRKDLDV